MTIRGNCVIGEDITRSRACFEARALENFRFALSRIDRSLMDMCMHLFTTWSQFASKDKRLYLSYIIML